MKNLVSVLVALAIGSSVALADELRPTPMFSGSEEVFEQGTYKVSCLTGKFRGGGYPDFRTHIIRVPQGETWAVRCEGGRVSTRKL